MKAIVAYGAKNYRFCEVDTPKVGEGEILIKIEAAGICASDRADYMGGDPWGGIESPRVPGHEFVGTVEEMMLYTELQSAVHAMIQRLEYSFTFNPSLLTSPKRKKQVTEILTEAEKYIWRIKEEIRCA